MKKSHRTETRNLRISQKAYDRFRERIKYVCNLFALDSHYLLWLMEEYLNGYTHLKSGGGLVTDFAFQLLRDELDRAMTRSRRAREQARIRRERKAQERKEQEQREQERQKTPPADDASVLEVNERHDVARADLNGNEQDRGERDGLQNDGRCHKSALDGRGYARGEHMHDVTYADGKYDGEITLDKLRRDGQVEIIDNLMPHYADVLH